MAISPCPPSNIYINSFNKKKPFYDLTLLWIIAYNF